MNPPIQKQLWCHLNDIYIYLYDSIVHKISTAKSLEVDDFLGPIEIFRQFILKNKFTLSPELAKKSQSTLNALMAEMQIAWESIGELALYNTNNENDIQKLKAIEKIFNDSLNKSRKILDIDMHYIRDLINKEKESLDTNTNSSLENLENKISRIESYLIGTSKHLDYAKQYVTSDPSGSLAKSRLVCEKILVQHFTKTMGALPKKPMLGEILSDNQFTRKIEKRILSRFNSVRDMGNLGAHGEMVTSDDAKRAFDDLLYLIDWYLDSEDVASL